MKTFAFFLVVIIGLGVFLGCKKSNSSSDSVSLTGTHQFSGIADYVFTGFISFPPAAELNVADTFTTVITRAASPDSSDFIYLPATSVDPGPLGGIYLVFTTNLVSSSVPVAIEVADTLLTIPNQYPYSGGDLYVEGDGSFVNNKITLRYHTWYREYNKYDTAVSVR